MLLSLKAKIKRIAVFLVITTGIIGAFDVHAAPTVSSVDPTSGLPETSVTVNGTNFGEGDSYTKLLLHNNGTGATFEDFSLSPKAVTKIGNATQSTTQSKFGGSSLYLEGSTSYLSVANSADFNFGTSSFTIDWWEYRTSNAAGDASISRDNAGYSPFVLGYLSGANLVLYMTSTGSSWDIAEGKSMGAVTYNQWVHLALVRNGNTFYTFKNGILVSTWTSSASVRVSSGALLVGSYQGTSNLGGYIDELRISNGVARWTSNFTPPNAEYFLPSVSFGSAQSSSVALKTRSSLLTSVPEVDGGLKDVTVSNVGGASATLSSAFNVLSAGPTISSVTPSSGSVAGGDSVTISGSGFSATDSYSKLLLHADGAGNTFLDSATSKTVTSNGNVTQSVTQSKFGGKSAYFDGDGDYLNLADSDDWDFGSGNFTVDFWMKPSVIDAWDTVIEYSKGAANADSSWYAGFWSDSTFFASIFDTNGVQYNARNLATVNDGNWHHVAMIRNGGQFIVAIDGQFGTPVDVTGKTVRKFIGNDLRIGLFYNAQFFNGYIDELRVSKGIARWTSNFATPIYPYAANVIFGGTAASSANFVNSTTISAITPAHFAGDVDLTVINADAQVATLTNGYTYTEIPPAVLGITPNNGTIDGGTNVTIYGSNFIPPNSGGAASWQTVSSKTLPGNLVFSSVAAIGQYIYAFGGHNGSSYTNVIYRASVSDPTTWSDTGKTLPSNLAFSHLAVIGDYVYLFGGWTGSAGTNAIYRASVSDPTTWTTVAGKTLPADLMGGSLEIVGSSIYIFGGYTGSNFTNTIFSASVSDPTTWTNTASTLPVNLGYAQIVEISGNLYIFGGKNTPTSYSSDIYSASSSNPTSWSDVGNLPEPLHYAQLAVVGSNMYLYGGYNGSSASNKIYTASVATPTSWSNSGSVLPSGLYGHSASIIDSNIYLFGGSNGSSYTNVINRAPVVHNRANVSNPSWITNWQTMAADQSNVTVGGVSATNINFVNSTTITATTSANTSGEKDVVVTNYDAQNSTLSGVFTYIGTPTISTVTPSTGSVAGGDSVTISGSSFVESADAYTKLLLHADGTGSTFLDSANNKTVTVNGSITQSNTQSKFGGKSAYFGGTDSYLSFADSQDWTFGSGDFSVDFWVNFDDIVNPKMFFVTNNNGAGGSDAVNYSLIMWRPTTGFEVDFMNSSVRKLYQQGNIDGWSPNTWYHMAVARSGNTVYVFRNGQQMGTLDVTGFSLPDNDTINIGRWAWAGSNYHVFKGYLDEFRVSKGIARWTSGFTPESSAYRQANVMLGSTPVANASFVNSTTISAVTPAHTAGQVDVVVTNPNSQSATLTNGFTYLGNPPLISSITPNLGPTTGGTNVTISGSNFLGNIDSSTKLLLHGDGSGSTFVDSATNKTILVSGDATQSATQSKFGGKSIYFDNTGDNLYIGQSADWELGNTWTVETWLYPTTFHSPYNTIYSYVPGGWFEIFLDGSGQVKISSNANGEQTWTGGSVPLNQWSHFAMVSNGGSVTAYINGNSVGTKSITYPTGTTGTLMIGWDTAAGREFTGYMDEFRISKGVARWTSNFSVPNSQYYANATVSFGGTAATNVNIVNSSTITATTPLHAFGPTDVVVANYDGQSSTLSEGFTFSDPPTVSSVTPSSGILTGGNSVTISGTNFYGTPAVTFGGTSATAVTVVNATTITATVPAHAVGQVNVVVTNPDAQVATLTNGYTYTEIPPTISSITPNSGPVSGGTSVTISGSNFSESPDTYTKLLIHGDGIGSNFLDLSKSRKSVSIEGNTTQSATQSKFGGKSIFFDGTVDDLYIPSSSDWELGSTWTIDMWLYPTALNSSYNTLYSWAIPGAWLQIFLDGSGNVKMATNANGEQTWSGPVTLNQWNHIAIVSNGGTVTVYKNGVSLGSRGITAPTGSGSLRIGWDGGTAGREFVGYMDEYRISKGIARWTSNFTTPTAPYKEAEVTIGGIARVGTFVNSTSINTTTPAHIAGAVDVVVTNHDGQSSTLAGGFTYASPIVSTINPSSVNNNQIYNGISITGENFTSGSSVKFVKAREDDLNCLNVNVIDATSLTCDTNFTGIQPGVWNVQVTNSDGISGTLTDGLTVVGYIAKSAFVTNSQTIKPDVASYAINLQLQDAGNRATNATALTSFNLSSTSATGQFSLSRTSWSPVTSVSFAEGENTKTIFYKDSALGTHTISAAENPSNGWSDASQDVVISENAPYVWPFDVSTDYSFDDTKIEVQDSVSKLTDLSASGSTIVNQQTATFQYSELSSFSEYLGQNNQGSVKYQLSHDGGTTWYWWNGGNWAATLQGVTQANDAATIDSNILTFHSQTNQIGIANLTVRAYLITNGTQNVELDAVAVGYEIYPYRYNFVSSPSSLSEGEIGTYTIQAQDQSGNAMSLNSDVTLNLGTSTPLTGKFAIDLDEDISTRWDHNSVTMLKGQSSATVYYKDSAKGTKTLTATPTDGNSSIAASLSQEVKSQYRLRVTGVSDPVAMGVPSSVTIQAVDYLGSPVYDFTGTVHFSSDDAMAYLPANFTFTSEMLGNHTFVNGVTMMTQGEKCVTVVDVSDSNISGSQCDVTVTEPLIGNVSNFEIITSAQYVPVETVSNPITIQMQDSANNPAARIGDTTIYISHTSPTGQISLNGVDGWSSGVVSAVIPASQTSINVYFKDSQIGSYSIKVGDDADNQDLGFTNDTQEIFAVAGPPASFSFDSSLANVGAGAVTGPHRISLRDSAGNIVTTSNQQTVYVKSTNGLISLDGVNDWTNNFSSTINTGESGLYVYYRNDNIGSDTVSVSDANPADGAIGLDDAQISASIVAGTIANLEILSAPETLATSQISSQITVQARDQFGNIATAASNLPLYFYSDSDTQFSATSSPFSPISSISIPTGQSTISFYVKQLSLANDITIMVSDNANAADGTNGIDDASATIAITQGAPSIAKITSAPITAQAGQLAGPITVELRNDSNQAVAALSDTLVNLEGASGFANAQGDSINDITIPTGSSSGQFYFKASEPQTTTMTISSDGLTGDTQDITFVWGNVASLDFTAFPNSVVAGSANAYTVSLKNAYGVVVPTASPITVALATNSGSGRFDTATDGSFDGSISSLSIGTGETSKNFYYKDTVSGTYTISAAADALTGDSGSVSVIAADPAVLVPLTGQQTIVKNTASDEITLQVRDQFGNTKTVSSDYSLTLSSNSSDYGFSVSNSPWISVNSITIPSGQSQISVYYKDQIIGQHLLSFQTSFGSVTQLMGVIEAPIANNPPAKLLFQNLPQTFVINNEGTFNFYLADADNNYVAAQDAISVTVTSSAATGTFFDEQSQNWLNSLTIDFAQGETLKSFKYKDSLAGSPMLTISANGLTSATQQQNIENGAVEKITSEINSSLLTTDRAALTINLETNTDLLAKATSDVILNLNTTLSGGKFYDGAGNEINSVMISSGNSSATVYYQQTVPGVATITVDENPSRGWTSSQNEVTVSAQRTHLRFSTSAQSAVAGAVSSIMTVRLQDYYGNILPAESDIDLYLSSQSGFGQFSMDAAQWNSVNQIVLPAGSSAVSFYYKDTAAGTHQLIVSDVSSPAENPDSGLANALQAVTINADTAVRIAPVAGENQNLLAGEPSSIVTVQLRDQYGNAKTVTQQTTLYLHSTSDSGVFSLDQNFSQTVTSMTVQAGSSAASFYYHNVVEGTDTLTVSSSPTFASSGLWNIFSTAHAAEGDLISATITVNVEMGEPAKLLWETLPSNQSVGDDSIQVTVKTTNEFDVEIPVDSDQNIYFSTDSAGQFSSDGNSWGASLTSVIVQGESRKTVYYRDEAIGNHLLTVSDVSSPAENPDTGLVNATGYISMVYGQIAKIVFTSSPQAITANHESAAMTIQTRNVHDVSVPVPSDKMIYLRTTSNRGTFSANNVNWGINGVSIPAGQSQVNFYYKDPQSGSPQITASDALPILPDTAWTNAQQTQTIVAQDVASLRVTNISDPQYQGTPSSLVVMALDADNYVVEEYDGTLETFEAFDGGGNPEAAILPTATYTFDPAIDRGIKTFTNAVAFLSAGEKSVKVTDANGINGTQSNITVVDLPVVAVGQVKFISPEESLSAVSGSATELVTIQLQDSEGNPVNATSDFEVKLSSDSSTGEFSVNGADWSESITLTVPFGINFASFYYKNTETGNDVITAIDFENEIDDPSIANDSFDVTVSSSGAQYLKITGSENQVAGSSQNVSIVAYDSFGNIDTNYSGTKNITFSGAGISNAANVATCTNAQGDAIEFGSVTEMDFVAGTATCLMKLYLAEEAEIDATDGLIDSMVSEEYDLNVAVSFAQASAAKSLLSASPNPQKENAPVTVTVNPKDAYLNLVDYSNLTVTFTVEGANTIGSTNLSYDSALKIYSGTYTPVNDGTDIVKAKINGSNVENDTEGSSDGLFHLIIEEDGISDETACSYIKIDSSDSSELVFDVCIKGKENVTSEETNKSDDGNTGVLKVKIETEDDSSDLEGLLKIKNSISKPDGFSLSEQYQARDYMVYKYLTISSDFSFDQTKTNLLKFRIAKSWQDENSIVDLVAVSSKNGKLQMNYMETADDYDIYSVEAADLDGYWAILGIVAPVPAENVVTGNILFPVVDYNQTSSDAISDEKDDDGEKDDEGEANNSQEVKNTTKSIFGITLTEEAAKVVETISIVSTVAAAASAAPVLPNIVGMIRSLSAIPMRRRRRWGMVYDTQTGKPIPHALVTIYDSEGKVKEIKNSDDNGAYYFMAREGVYTVEAIKEGYVSMENINSASFRTYYDNSFDKGDKITLEHEDIVSVNIPMKKVSHGVVSELISKTVILHVIFWIGFAASFVAIVLHPSFFNAIVLLVFVLNFVLTTFMFSSLKPAKLVNENGVPVPFAVVKVFDEAGNLVVRTAANEKGNFVVILDAGSYIIEFNNGTNVSRHPLEIKKRKEVKGEFKF